MTGPDPDRLALSLDLAIKPLAVGEIFSPAFSRRGGHRAENADQPSHQESSPCNGMALMS